jgi:hypothetical protein
MKKREKEIHLVYFRVHAECKKMSSLKGLTWTKFKVKILKYNSLRKLWLLRRISIEFASLRQSLMVFLVHRSPTGE